MSITCVLGAVRSGKSTFIDQQFSTNTHVIVRIGAFMRESVGISAMMEDPDPNQCRVLETWVRQIAWGAVGTATELNRPLVFDGFPRGGKQAEWLLQLAGDTSIKVVRISGSAEIIGQRQKTVFDKVRQFASTSGVDEAIEVLGKHRDFSLEIRDCVHGQLISENQVGLRQVPE